MPRSLRIAIADDEREVRQYFAQALNKLGHQVVVVAKDGQELVDGCQANRPELLVTDIRMEGMTGIEAMQQLAQQGPIPTILISAHYRAEELDADLDGQVLTFLAKPVKLAELAAAVNEFAES